MYSSVHNSARIVLLNTFNLYPRCSDIRSVVCNRGCEASFLGMREAFVLMTRNWSIYYSTVGCLFPFTDTTTRFFQTYVSRY